MDEFELIARYFAPLQLADPDLILGTGDDAAVFALAPGAQLVVAVDTVVEGVHFPAGTPAAAIGYRVAAVNLSDFAAMGAVPRYATLALTLPQVDAAWLAGFAAGLGRALAVADVSLIGGDTTRGPLTATVQMMGVAAGPLLTRRGAHAGDVIAVSGTLGDACAGLAVLQAAWPAVPAHPLVERFLWPVPRLALGQALNRLASAAIDISDGLLADVGHLAQASACRAVIEVDQLPLSAALLAHCAGNEARRCALSGGDDYELALCIPAPNVAAAHAVAEQQAVPFSVIGQMHAGHGVSCRRRDGRVYAPPARGYRHFT